MFFMYLYGLKKATLPLLLAFSTENQNNYVKYEILFDIGHSGVCVFVRAAVVLGCSECDRPLQQYGRQKEQPVVAEKVKPPKKMGTGGTKAVIPDSSTPGTRPSEEELGGGQWNIAAVGDHKIEVEEDIPYVNFQPSTGRFYASDGCNVLNGDYVMRSDGVMTFSNVLSTMKYCHDVEFAPLISAALADGAAPGFRLQPLGTRHIPVSARQQRQGTAHPAPPQHGVP